MNLSIQKMPADKGMRLVTSMIKAGYISEYSGIYAPYISMGMTHQMRGGKPYTINLQIL